MFPLRKVIAEAIGTLWLVLGGCGAAVLASAFMPTTNLGIGLVGVALAFGLTVVTGAYAFGHISGGHFNPAVTLGVLTARRIEPIEAIWYIVAQCVGAIVGAGILVAIAYGQPGFSVGLGPGQSNLAVNGWGDLSPGGYNFGAALLVEVVMTFFFLLVILGVTGRDALAELRPAGDRPVAHAHPPHQHPGDQHVGEPGPLPRPGGVRRGPGAHAALAVLGRSDRRRGAGGARPPVRDRGAGRDPRGLRLNRVEEPPRVAAVHVAQERRVDVVAEQLLEALG